MKVKLLKKLRKEAIKRYRVIQHSRWYYLQKYDYEMKKWREFSSMEQHSLTNNWGCNFINGGFFHKDPNEVIELCKKFRRNFIIARVRQMKLSKIQDIVIY